MNTARKAHGIMKGDKGLMLGLMLGVRHSHRKWKWWNRTIRTCKGSNMDGIGRSIGWKYLRGDGGGASVGNTPSQESEHPGLNREMIGLASNAFL